MDSIRAYKQKASSSLKWTTIGELAAKAIVPITNMILARLLSPEVFGLVASITVITNFAEIVAESGFSRYILQQKFASEKKKKQSAGTATIFSLFVSILIFIIISIFSKQFSSFVGASGCEFVLIFSAAQIPVYAITSIQMSLYRRDFKFGYLAIVRVSSCLIQLIVSFVVAFAGLGVWSIPAGTLASLVCQFVLMIIFNKNSFCISFSWVSFKEMWASSGLFLISAIVVWADSSINVLFASHFLGAAESGFIKNGFTTATGIISLMTAIYSPVLISLLAKLVNGTSEYHEIFNKYQKAMSALFVPLGIGMFVFQSFLCYFFFGDGWEQAGIVLGCIGLVGCIRAASGNFIITAWTAQGKPIWIFLSDLLSCLFLICTWLVTKGLDYRFIVICISCAYFPTNFLCIALCKRTLHIKPSYVIKNTFGCFGPGVLMGLFGYLLTQIFYDTWVCVIYIFLCIIFYFSILIFSYNDYFECIVDTFGGSKLLKLFAKNEPYALFAR